MFLLSYLLCSICGQLSDGHSGRLILWVANFMAILCSGSFITDAWHAAAGCSGDIERDGALLNIPFWLVSLFLCRGAVDVKALWHEWCGGWPALAVERLMKSQTLWVEPPPKKKHLKCACQLASWTFYDWWRVRGGHCHRGVSVMVERTEGCGGSQMDAVIQAHCGTFSRSVWLFVP